MKLTQTDIANLYSVLNACSIVNIDAIRINENGLAGVNPDKSCVFFMTTKIPVIPAPQTLNLSKLRVLKQRMDLFKTDPKLSIETKQNPKGDIATLEIRGTNASAQFRAGTSNTVKVPTGIDDTPVKSIVISKEEAQFILNADKAMSAKKVTINVKKNNAVSIEFADSSNDLFVIDLVAKAIDIGDNTSGFVNFYFTDVFTSLLRAAIVEQPEVEIKVFEASATMTVDDYQFTLLSPMDND